MRELGQSERPILQHRYLHLMPEDTILWQKFIQQGLFLPDEVWYDVRVGKGIEVESGQPEWMKKFAEYCYRKRIDIVGKKGEDYWIIECKPFAGIVALGQVIYYSQAFLAEYKPKGEVETVIITDNVDKDVLPIFEGFEVLVFEVGVATEQDRLRIMQEIQERFYS